MNVHCNMANTEFCIDTNGKKCDVVASLPTTTTQVLFGSVSRYNDQILKVKYL
jgi:hypothetical protein